MPSFLPSRRASPSIDYYQLYCTITAIQWCEQFAQSCYAAALRTEIRPVIKSDLQPVVLPRHPALIVLCHVRCMYMWQYFVTCSVLSVSIWRCWWPSFSLKSPSLSLPSLSQERSVNVLPARLSVCRSLPPPRRICNRRCLFVCLPVSSFAQKLPNGFAWNFQGRLAIGQRTNPKFWWRSGWRIRIRIRIATLVRRALAEICIVVLLVLSVSLTSMSCIRSHSVGKSLKSHCRNNMNL